MWQEIERESGLFPELGSGGEWDTYTKSDEEVSPGSPKSPKRGADEETESVKERKRGNLRGSNPKSSSGPADDKNDDIPTWAKMLLLALAKQSHQGKPKEQSEVGKLVLSDFPADH